MPYSSHCERNYKKAIRGNYHTVTYAKENNCIDMYLSMYRCVSSTIRIEDSIGGKINMRNAERGGFVGLLVS